MKHTAFSILVVARATVQRQTRSATASPTRAWAAAPGSCPLNCSICAIMSRQERRKAERDAAKPKRGSHGAGGAAAAAAAAARADVMRTGVATGPRRRNSPGRYFKRLEPTP